MIFVNDGFTGLPVDIVAALCGDILTQSYSSIDYFLYLTVNRYVEIVDSNKPKLLWVPSYSSRANDSLVDFIDDLGRKWFDFLEKEIGPFNSRTETSARDVLINSKAIILPKEEKK